MVRQHETLCSTEKARTSGFQMQITLSSLPLHTRLSTAVTELILVPGDVVSRVRILVVLLYEYPSVVRQTTSSREGKKKVKERRRRSPEYLRTDHEYGTLHCDPHLLMNERHRLDGANALSFRHRNGNLGQPLQLFRVVYGNLAEAAQPHMIAHKQCTERFLWQLFDHVGGLPVVRCARNCGGSSDARRDRPLREESVTAAAHQSRSGCGHRSSRRCAA